MVEIWHCPAQVLPPPSCLHPQASRTSTESRRGSRVPDLSSHHLSTLEPTAAAPPPRASVTPSRVFSLNPGSSLPWPLDFPGSWFSHRVLTNLSLPRWFRCFLLCAVHHRAQRGATPGPSAKTPHRAASGPQLLSWDESRTSLRFNIPMHPLPTPGAQLKRER